MYNPRNVAISPYGSLVAGASGRSEVVVRRMATGERVALLEDHKMGVATVAFGPSDGVLATGDGEGVIRLWAHRAETAEVLKGASRAAVQQLLFLEHGAGLAAAHADGVIQVWDLRARTCRQRLAGHEDAVDALAIGSAAGTLVSVGEDDRCIAWDLGTGRPVRQWPVRRGVSSCLGRAADGRLVLASAGRRGLVLADLDTGHDLAVLPGDRSPRGLALSPDGRRLVWTNGDRQLGCWDTVTGAAEVIFQAERGQLGAVAFSPDGATLVCLGAQGDWHMCSVGDAPPARALAGVHPGARRVAFSFDGDWLVTAGTDQTVKVWNAAGAVPSKDLLCDGGPVVALAFQQDACLLAAASAQGTVTRWDAASGQCLGTRNADAGALNALAHAPNGPLMAVAGDMGDIRLCDAGTLGESRLLGTHPGGVLCLAFCPAGTWLASGGRDGNVTVWDVATCRAHHTFQGHRAAVTDLAFDPTGRTLVSGGDDHTVRMWDIEAGVPGPVMAWHAAPVTGVAFAPNGRIVASSSRDGTVRLWTRDGVMAPRVLVTAEQHVERVAFSRKGDVLAGVGGDGCKLWELEAPRPARQAHDAAVVATAWLPSGEAIASADGTGVLRAWCAADGRLLWSCTGHVDGVEALAISPDGRWLASASRCVVRIRDMRSGEPGPLLHGHTGRVTGLAFRADAGTLLSVDGLGQAIEWNAHNGAQLHAWRFEREAAEAMAFSLNGQLLASICRGTLTVRDTTSRRRLLSARDLGATNLVGFAPDGASVFTLRTDTLRPTEAVLRVWDVGTGQSRHVQHLPLAAAHAVVANPTGGHCVISRRHPHLVVLDARWSLGPVLNGHADGVVCAAVSPDGRAVATGGREGALRLWAAATGELLHSFAPATRRTQAGDAST
jgi:WD40 repeat protein